MVVSVCGGGGGGGGGAREEHVFALTYHRNSRTIYAKDDYILI